MTAGACQKSTGDFFDFKREQNRSVLGGTVSNTAALLSKEFTVSGCLGQFSNQSSLRCLDYQLQSTKGKVDSWRS